MYKSSLCLKFLQGMERSLLCPNFLSMVALSNVYSLTIPLTPFGSIYGYSLFAVVSLTFSISVSVKFSKPTFQVSKKFQESHSDFRYKRRFFSHLLLNVLVTKSILR